MHSARDSAREEWEVFLCAYGILSLPHNVVFAIALCAQTHMLIVKAISAVVVGSAVRAFCRDEHPGQAPLFAPCEQGKIE